MTTKQLLSNKSEDINSKLNKDELNNFTADCLKKYCKENSIPIATTKANIILNLIKYFNDKDTTTTESTTIVNDTTTTTTNKLKSKPTPTIVEQKQQQQQQQPIKSILKKINDNNDNNKENNVNNMNEIINKVEKLTIAKKEVVVVKTRKQAAIQQQQNNEQTTIVNKKVSFNPVNQIGFIERKEKNQIKYYINTNQNSPIKNESPLKIINNQLYNIFNCAEEEEQEFDTEAMSKSELKEALEKNGLSSEGDKKSLKDRLEQFIIETLNNSHDDDNNNNSDSEENNNGDKKDDNSSEDWIRWTPLKAKYNKSKPTEHDDDDGDIIQKKQQVKTIKSKSKPTKKINRSSKKQQQQHDDDDDDNDDYELGVDQQQMNSQQLFNAFLDVSISNKKAPLKY